MIEESSSEEIEPVPMAQSNSTIHLAIGRPAYYGYDTDKKTQWFAALLHEYLHFKISAAPSLCLIDPGDISAQIPRYWDYSRRVSKRALIEAAQTVSGTHLVYIEYEPTGETMVKLDIKMFPVQKGQSEENAIQTVDLDNINAGMDACVDSILAILEIPSADRENQLRISGILGSKAKSSRALGKNLIAAGESGKSTLNEIAEQCTKIAADDPDMALALYSASNLYARADNFKETLEPLNRLIGKFDDAHPRLHIKASAYYRKSKRPEKASAIINTVPSEGAIKQDVLYEKGMTLEAMKNIESARSSFTDLLALNNSHVKAYIALARLSVREGTIKQADEFVKYVSGLSGKSECEIYLRIGKDLEAEKSHQSAILAYSSCVALWADYVDGWLALSEIQEKTGKMNEAAASYLKLFELDRAAYRDKALQAARLFEKSGNRDMAIEVYQDIRTWRSGDPEASIALAGYAFESDDCERTLELLSVLNQPWSTSENVQSMTDHCMAIKQAEQEKAYAQRDISLGLNETNTEKRSGFSNFVNITTGILAVGAFAGGLATNMLIDEPYDEYQKAGEGDIDRLHEELEQLTMVRNVLYAVAGVSATGLAFNVTIPIMRR
ncbi:MAG: hypothetical protein GF401_11770 [Chitinivibrionales bacterium]|nr:hypothetical protein [Chitinivibrionales bacterium]